MKKNLNPFVLIFLMFVSSWLSAQQVEHNGDTYYVKGKRILKDGKDVTKFLDADLQDNILEKHASQAKVRQESKEKDKALKKSESIADKAEKDLKKAEKEIKQKEKAQDNFEKAHNKLESAQKKFDRLKRKGKLSSSDEKDWLKKLEKLEDDVDKSKRKLRKS